MKPTVGRGRLVACALPFAMMMVLTSGAAHADQRCRDVRIAIQNNGNETIRVFKMEYEDIEDARVRTEQLPNAVVPAGMQMDIVKGLEYVGDERIGRVRVQFRAGIGTLRGWSSWKPSRINRCKRHDSLTHSVP
jgi:hypothetical protein